MRSSTETPHILHGRRFSLVCAACGRRRDGEEAIDTADALLPHEATQAQMLQMRQCLRQRKAAVIHAAQPLTKERARDSIGGQPVWRALDQPTNDAAAFDVMLAQGIGA